MAGTSREVERSNSEMNKGPQTSAEKCLSPQTKEEEPYPVTASS